MEPLSPASKIAYQMFTNVMNNDLQDAQKTQKDNDDKDIEEKQQA